MKAYADCGLDNFKFETIVEAFSLWKESQQNVEA